MASVSFRPRNNAIFIEILWFLAYNEEMLGRQKEQVNKSACN